MLGIPRAGRTVSIDAIRFRHVVWAVVLLGVLARVGFWFVYPPVWKLFSTFAAFDVGLVEYVADFEGYKPTRMPFYDVLVALGYAPFVGLLEHRALTVSSTVLTAASLPVFYGAVRRLFDRRVGLAALVLYAFYPKFVVMGAIGMPESVSVAFLTVALYGTTRGRSDEDGRWYAVGGVGLLLAYLTYIPAVIAAILVVLLAYAHRVTDDAGRSIIPDRYTVLLAGPSAVVGLVYLWNGPIVDLIRTGTGSDRTAQLFTSPEMYGTGERVLRYVSYTYYDFWWYDRGFDHEAALLSNLSSLEGFFGGLFPAYLLAVVVITLSLTVFVAAGVVTLARDRARTGLFVLTWLCTYALLYNLRNAGWEGAFQTRHVFPVFPAVCIAFGVGVVSVPGRYRKLRALTGRFTDDFDFDGPAVTIGCVLLALLVLVSVAGVYGTVVGQKATASNERPIDALQEHAGPGDSVVVFDALDYRQAVMYSGGDVRPRIVVETSREASELRYRSTLADVSVGDPADVTGYEDEFLFFRVVCGDLGPRERAFVDAAIDDGGEVVFEEGFSRGGGCETTTVIVRLR